jgi:hypothetical protein
LFILNYQADGKPRLTSADKVFPEVPEVSMMALCLET